VVIKVHKEGTYTLRVPDMRPSKHRRIPASRLRSTEPDVNEMSLHGVSIGTSTGEGTGRVDVGGAGGNSAYFERFKPKRAEKVDVASLPRWGASSDGVSAVGGDDGPASYQISVNGITQAASKSAEDMLVSPDSVAVGDSVLAMFNKYGRMMKAVVQSINADGSLVVEFDNYYRTVVSDLPLSNVGEKVTRPLEKGDKVFSKRNRYAYEEATIVDIVPPPNVAYAVNDDFNKKIVLWRGNITALNTDAIVNAANSGLFSGGGICGAIFAAAGRELNGACAKIGGCDTGSVALTPGFDFLPATSLVTLPRYPGEAHPSESADQ